MPTPAARVVQDPECRVCVGSIVPGLPGAHTQAATLDGLRANLREVLELLFEEDNSLRERLPRFVGAQQIGLA